ncbi:MAG TPA: 5-oxoprolinase subunit PxpB [Candidatus Acidoferrum sp.]|nr:5-oxoprolinase subunit PxpB [Candidatus Acidoferrum sp.]
MPASPSPAAQFRYASDQSLLVYFDSGDTPTSAAPRRQLTEHGHEHVRRLLRLLDLEPIPGVLNLHPAYGSILLRFNPLQIQHEELEAALRDCLVCMEKLILPEPRLVEIPVCYGAAFGPDLEEVARLHSLSPKQVMEIHSAQTYLVYFLGFVPGFAYLGDLPDAIATPRLPSPRKSVPAGSLGIAANQTGIYPVSTPGGWRLIGRTPLSIFQPQREKMSLLEIGDRVRFVPITPQKFSSMEKA